MAASITDKISNTSSGLRPVSTTVASTRSSGVTTLACADLTGWATDTAVHFVTYQIDGAGEVVSGTQVDWKGIVSGSNINNLTVTGGTDNGNAVGDIVEMLPTAAWGKELSEWALTEHNQNGTHDNTKLAYLATTQTFTGAKTFSGATTMSGDVTFSGDVNVNSIDISAAWADWTPGFTNFTLGNGTITYAKWTQVGKTVRFRLKVTLGSTSSVSGSIIFSAPVNTSAVYGTDDSILSTGTINDNLTARFVAKAVWISAATFALRVEGVGVNYGTAENTTGSIPMTWTTNDYFQIEGSYEAA